MSKEKESNTFHLAITMAGAVSAGAYTAGVMDYLIEVLDKWEQLKVEANEFFTQNPDESKYNEDQKGKAEFYKKVPTHNIQIDILSGASAGGMTSIITSAYLHLKKKYPLTFDKINTFIEKEDSSQAEKEFDDYAKNNLLYNTWVNVTESKRKSMLKQLLSLSDFEIIRQELLTAKSPKSRAPKLLSALNSMFIRQLAMNTIDIKPESVSELPVYVSEKLESFVTLTNLEGYQQIVPGSLSKNGVFISNNHKDAISFNFSKKNLDETGGIVNIDFTDTSPEMTANKQLFANAAIATGAFPIGLEYANLERKGSSIKNNPILKNIYDDDVLRLKAPIDNSIYRSTVVDGGVIDNEPFHLTEDRMKDKIRAEVVENQIGAALKDSTILMIDPFPSQERIEKNKSFADDPYPYSWLDAAIQFLFVMRTQSLVKDSKIDKNQESLIEKAFDLENSSIFMIAPRRYIYTKTFANSESKEEVINGDKAITCGSLFGFGGFLSKRFRQHDFFLGRINCQAFLRRHFLLEISNKNQDSAVIRGYNDESRKIFLFNRAKNQKQSGEYLPIIPDVSILVDKTLEESLEKYPLSYKQFQKFFPTFAIDDLDKIKNDLIARLTLLIDSELHAKNMNPIARFGVRWGIRIFKSAIFRKVKSLIEEELIKWKIIKN